MKKFLEDYGFTIVAAIVVISLIMIVTPIGSTIQKQTGDLVHSFAVVADDDFNKIDDSTLLIDLKNFNKSGVEGDFSRKGNLVTINNTQYRVLAVNGTQVKVMSMKNVGSSVFNQDYDNIYAESVLDIYLNETFYNSLPERIKNAIVEQSIDQSIYTFGRTAVDNADFSGSQGSYFTESDTYVAGYYYLQKGRGRDVGKRKIYALDIDDIIDYLGSSADFHDISEMFWNQKSYKQYNVNTGEGNIWLRSGYPNGVYVFYISGYMGIIDGWNHATSYYEVRPAFVLDLSLLSE